MQSAHATVRAPSRRQSFSVVLAIELWERFGFYGMQAVLLLYMVQHLGLSDANATLLIGAFFALTYILPVLGGLAGDRLIGARRCVVGGAALLAVGYVVLGIADTHRSLLMLGLSLISAGNGLFKPNAGNMVRSIYEGDDAALDAAFTLYYMAVNVGSTVSMLLTPWLQDTLGPSIAFFTCAGGLVFGLGYYGVFRGWVRHVGGKLERQPVSPKAALIVWGGTFVSIMAGVAILKSATIARDCMVVAAVLIALSWAWLYLRVQPHERAGMRLAYLLCAETMVYALFYQQQLTSLTLFALRAVDGTYRLGGYTLFHMSAGQFQALDPIWIMIASPLLAMLYNGLARSGRDFPLAWKIALGFVLGAIGFFVWWQSAAHAHGLVSAWVMVVGYGFASIAEVITMGLGLAVIARYVPSRLSGFMMGSLYLLWALAFYVGSVIANFASSDRAGSIAPGPAAFAPLLGGLFWALLAASIAALALLPLIARWERQHSAATNLVRAN